MHRYQDKLILRRERQSTCNHLEEQYTQRIEIAASISPVIRFKQFWCNIIDGTQHITRAGELCHIASYASNAEVCEIAFSTRIEQHVRSLDVAMNNSLAMDVVKGAGNGLQHVTCFYERERRAMNASAQGAPFQKGHYNIVARVAV